MVAWAKPRRSLAGYRAAEELAHGGPPLIWKAKGLGGGYSSPTVANRRIFVTGLLQGKLTMSSLSFDGESYGKNRSTRNAVSAPRAHEEPQQSMAIECTSFLETASSCA